MIRALGSVVMVAFVIFCIGIFRGWFEVETKNSGEEKTIELTVHKDAIKKDKGALNAGPREKLTSQQAAK